MGYVEKRWITQLRRKRLLHLKPKRLKKPIEEPIKAKSLETEQPTQI